MIQIGDVNIVDALVNAELRIGAWTNCKENRGFGYIVTLQDLLSALE